MAEVFSLYCDVGQTEATVLVEVGADLRDNVDCFVTEPCKGCKKWSAEKIGKVEAELKEEWGDRSGIRDGRANQLEQLLVDRARFKGGEHKLVVAMCSPITGD
ncbi:hypothetical protein HZB78_01715 [Candidatus Collierbacteria bacterium]|nr:hypothetical protein [Candidatus Collierbacteria bacterium]